MKKQVLFFILSVTSLTVSPLFGMRKIKEMLGFGDKQTRTSVTRRAGGSEPKLDRVDFWNKVVKALKKEGYAEDSLELARARKSLHRAETNSKKFGRYFVSTPAGEKTTRSMRSKKARGTEKEPLKADKPTRAKKERKDKKERKSTKKSVGKKARVSEGA